MLYLMKTMLEFCRIADLPWEPRKDILFLCQRFGEQVRSIRGLLDENLILNAFLRSNFFTRQPFGDQRRCYQTLLAKDPPLLVAQIPSTGQESHVQPQSELPRLRVASHPGQPAAGIVNPSQAQKAISSQKHATYHAPQPLGHATTPMMPPNMTNSTQDSRSRYRRVSTQGKDCQPGHIPQARAVSMQYIKQDPASSSSPQNFAPQATADGRTPTASRYGMSGMSPQSNQTTRTSSAGHPGYVPTRASGQPGLASNSSSFQQPQRQHHNSPTQSPDIPFSYSQRQQDFQATQTPPNGSAFKQPPAQNFPITSNSPPLQLRNAYQSTQQAHPESSRKPVPETQPANSSRADTKPDTKRKDSGSGLQIVGPEGLWAPSSPTLNTRHPPPPPPVSDATSKTIFELPAAKVHRLPRQNSATILAELSANIDDAIKTATTPPLSHSPPLEQKINHTKSESVELPASLSIRFSTSSSFSTGTATENADTTKTTATPPLPVPKTNASRYSQIFPAPPSNKMKVLTVSPTPPLTPAPLSIYKAYQPPARTTTWETLPASPPGEDAWMDARDLAREYQMELPGFEEGYGSI